MTPLAWLWAVGVLLWVAAAGAAGDRGNPEMLYGMLGPLLATSGTWVAVERVYRSSPERLTATMVGALAVKAVFFGVYVVVMLRGLDLRPVPFVTSFTGHFIALYALQALFLRRLFAGALPGPR